MREQFMIIFFYPIQYTMDTATTIADFASKHKAAVIGVCIAVAIVVLLLIVYYTGVIPGFSSESLSVERELDNLITSIMSRQKKLK